MTLSYLNDGNNRSINLTSTSLTLSQDQVSLDVSSIENVINNVFVSKVKPVQLVFYLNRSSNSTFNSSTGDLKVTLSDLLGKKDHEKVAINFILSA